MITAMRKGAAGWLAKILFALLILSFGAWGIADYLQPDPDPVVITVGDAEVRQSTLRNRFGDALDRLRRQLGPQTATQEYALQAGLDEQVIDAIIDRQALTREALAMGLLTDDGMLRSVIARDEAFHDVAGNFSMQRYRNALFQAGMTEDRFLTEVRGRLLRDPLLGAAAAAPPLPEAVAAAQFAYAAERRRAVVLHKAFASLPAPEAPGENALRQFYDGEASLYRQPELRELTAVVLSPERLAQGFAVADERIAEEYERRGDRYFAPESRDVAQLVFEDEQAAADAVARLRGGENWASVVDGSAGVATDLSRVRAGGMLPRELGAPAFALPEAGYTDPIRTAFGHHVVWVKDIHPAATAPLDEVREEIRLAVALELAVDELIERANTLEDAMLAGDGLESAAAAAGLEVERFEGIDRTGRNAAGARPEGLPQAARFLAVAFRTEEGENSVLTETPNGGYFVLRVDRVLPEVKKPFERVRAQVLADWTEAQRADRALSLAAPVADALRSGGDPAEIAENNGFEVARPDPFTRREAPQPLTPALVESLFATPEGEVVLQNGFDRVFVAVLQDRLPPEETEAGVREQVAAVIDRDRRLEVVRAFQRAVRARYSVEIDRAGIDRVLR